jgi:putative transposase
MSDSLYAGKRFRTFNVIDDFNREVLLIEIDTSITGRRLIRIFERLQLDRGLPDLLRVDNGPEFLSGEFITWAESAGMMIQYIQPGKPNQNVYIERFNRTYRNELLDLYEFRNLTVSHRAHKAQKRYEPLKPDYSTLLFSVASAPSQKLLHTHGL